MCSTATVSEMFLIRLLIVGDSGVGKTSLLIRFHENQFMFTQKTTIGVDYKAKECEVDGELVKLQVSIAMLFFYYSIITVVVLHV